jgi:hypothetical protein
MTDHHRIDVEQLLADQLATASPDLLRGLLSTFIQALMSAEADAVCGAGSLTHSALYRPIVVSANAAQGISDGANRRDLPGHRQRLGEMYCSACSIAPRSPVPGGRAPARSTRDRRPRNQ